MNSNQVFTEIRATGSDITINYFYNSEMREHMFDKVLTPSDVGKLNRLVIPKQHAENYFSLEENQQETVLDFQDRNGKMWRFRYCYWTSSQSYVITRGWNRFVKEKKLSAGDITSFHRGYIPDSNEPEQRRKIMFIDWRHRADFNNMYQHNFIFGSPTNLPEYSMPSYRSYPPFYQGYGGYGRIVNGGRFYAGSPMDHHQWNVGRYEPLVYDSVPVFQVPPPPQPSTAKKLRLFGVDVEESSSSGETRGEMGVVGYSPSSPVVTRDDVQSSWRSPRGEMGASSSLGLQLSDDEAYKRKGKSLQF